MSTLVPISIALFVGQFIPYGNANLTQVVVQKAWSYRVAAFGEPTIGIFDEDEKLGWKLKPNASGTHYQPYVFDAEYNVDEEGNRITPGNYQQPKILFLGGSFTFGNGVDDHETFPYKLGSIFPDHKIINGAVMAWGTAQAWVKLQKSFEKYDDIDLVVYGFITHHLSRNYLNKDWLLLLESWGRKNPYFETEDGELYFRGLADAEKNGIPSDEKCDAKETEITLTFLQKMKSLCNNEGVPFAVLHLPAGVDDMYDINVLDVMEEDRYVDLRKKINYEGLKLERDVHYSQKGHDMVLEQISPEIKNWLQKPASILVANEVENN